MSKKQQESQEKQETKKDLEVKPEDASLANNSNLDYSGNEEADATDIIVPRILLMQGTSKKWVPDIFNMGDIIDSVEEELLAKKGETLKIIPFIIRKTWQEFTDEQPPVWVRSRPWNAANDQDPWKFTEEDPERGTVEMFRQRNYGFYCFVLDKDGAIDEYAIPALINFRSASGFKEGKKIASWFARMRSMKKPGFTVSWKISSESVKDGDKAYMKFNVARGENVTEDQQKVILKWLDLFATQQQAIKDHDVDEGATEVGSAPMQSGEVQQQAQF